MVSPSRANRFSDQLEDLNALLETVWASLENAERTPNDPWTLMTLGNVIDGESQQRLLMVREASRESASIMMHTDVRSPKVSQLEAEPTVTLHLYDWNERVQLVAKGVASIHRTGELVDQQWEQTALSSRRAYLAPQAPGEYSDVPTVNLPDEFQQRLPTEEEVQSGKENFAVITCELTAFDLLILKSDGNIRADFHRTESQWIGQWINP